MVKRPERDIYYSSTYTVEVKNAWSCTATPPIYLHGVVTNNFTLFKTSGYSTVRIYFPDILQTTLRVHPFSSILAPLSTFQIFGGRADGLAGATPEMLRACAI